MSQGELDAPLLSNPGLENRKREKGARDSRIPDLLRVSPYPDLGRQTSYSPLHIWIGDFYANFDNQGLTLEFGKFNTASNIIVKPH